MALRRNPGRPKEKLSQEDIEYFQDNGLNDSEIELMEQRLKRGTWSFSARARHCRLNLSQEEDRLTRDGRTIPGRARSAQFSDHFYDTNDWEYAKRIYISDAFANKRVIDVNEKQKVDQEEEYQAFKEKVLSEPDRLERLRQDLFSEELIENDGSNVS
jgi:hypothetical protein